VCEKRVLRIIFGLQEGKIEWRKLQNEELHDLSSSSNIIRMIKSMMRWASYIACIEDL
jgi:hypothetical protein